MHLLAIDRGMTALDGYRTATIEADMFVGHAQQALGVLVDIGTRWAPAC